MSNIHKDFSVIITFRTPNGNMWEESHSSTMIDIFKKDPTVYEIRNRDNDNLIYKKEGK